LDFAIEVDPDAERDVVRIVSRDSGLPVPLEVRSTAIRFTWNTGELAIMMGDLLISKAWADLLEQPYLAGQWIGVFDLELAAKPATGEAIAPEPPAEGRGDPPDLDVTLGELYGITSQGHIGTHPTGTAGLSAATTSCNTGNVRVPWDAPMAETHPLIGLALFRIDSDGILEMIGQNWLKHGFLALANDQCNLGCEGCGGNVLCIGCSDTYSAGNNGSRHYLGPRWEVNPFTAEWEACGSHFDGVPVDCERSHFDTGHDPVDHRLEVYDGDLANPGATYFYEGVYYVADDTRPENSCGWRECTMSWSGSNWSFSTVGGGLAPTPRPFAETWGDEHVTKDLADDDGAIILATQVTDLGGGTWHYEYALYNWYSERGVRSFAVPVGGVNISHPSFHDIDQDPGNDWDVTIADGAITWSTDDYATDPDAHALFFQTLFNFRFDADQAPTDGAVALGIFKPGSGSSLLLPVQTPTASTAIIAGHDAFEDFTLMANEPNPFSRDTEVTFALGRGRDVRLSVLDVSGRLVQILIRGPAPAGLTTARWDGRDTAGVRVASGVYFFRLESGDQVRTVKGTFLR
jgi:hypothetical protein